MFAALTLPFVAMFVIVAIGALIKMRRAKERPVSRTTAVARGLRIAGIAILAAGLTASAFCYRLAATEGDDGAIGYDVEGGTAYAVRPEESKRYQRQMEEIGGKANLLATEIADYWRGKKLAYMLAALSLGGSLVCFVLAHLEARLPPLDGEPPPGP